MLVRAIECAVMIEVHELGPGPNGRVPFIAMKRSLLVEDIMTQIASRQLVAVVGAGCSIFSTNQANCASWTGLLNEAVRWCVELDPTLPAGWGDLLRREIRSGDLDDLLSAAEKLTQKLGGREGGEYARWLRETVGSLRPERPEFIRALQALNVPLATTNYDTLIEQVTGLRGVPVHKNRQAERIIRGDDRAVLHLHGYWEEPETVVLGIRSYMTHGQDAHAQAVERVLAMTKSLLFVGMGAGLDDPNFRALRDWMRVTMRGSEYRHFRLAPDEDVNRLHLLHVDDGVIRVVGHGNGHESVIGFLGSLVSGDTSATPADHPSGQERLAASQQTSGDTSATPADHPSRQERLAASQQTSGDTSAMPADHPSRQERLPVSQHTSDAIVIPLPVPRMGEARAMARLRDVTEAFEQSLKRTLPSLSDVMTIEDELDSLVAAAAEVHALLGRLPAGQWAVADECHERVGALVSELRSLLMRPPPDFHASAPDVGACLGDEARQFIRLANRLLETSGQ